jgi:DNA (cytosine-5)-methyltransferase 1
MDDNYKNADMNMLYWLEEEFRVQYDDIYGKFYMAFITNILDPLAWSADGPDRFYFSKKYDFLTGTVIADYQIPSAAKLTGKEVYVNNQFKFVDEDKLQ